MRRRWSSCCARVPRDDQAVRRSQRLPVDTLVAELVRTAPLHGVADDRAILCRTMTWTKEWGFLKRSCTSCPSMVHRLIFEVGRAE